MMPFTQRQPNWQPMESAATLLPTSMVGNHAWRFCVAPMMDATDRHCRYFHRQLSRHARLYTEMLHADALRHGDRDRLLAFDAAEHPVALQLGGSEPSALAEASRLASDYGYDEVNLNCGCPSERVQKGRFGACLMLEPNRVAECVDAMRQATTLPVTVKCRLGVDEVDDEPSLHHFITRVAEAGCATFIVHARKAWLSGLSPKENREIPPLRYDVVIRLKRAFQHLAIVINGGINNVQQAEPLLETLDGVMLGRAAYDTPWLLSEVDQRLFGAASGCVDRISVLHAMRPYIEQRLAEGTPLASITRHMTGLFKGQAGGRVFRRIIAERAHKPGAGFEVVEAAIDAMTPRHSRTEKAH